MAEENQKKLPDQWRTFEIPSVVTRRRFMKKSAIAAGIATTARIQAVSEEWFMPDESDPHERTWMAFGASHKIWGQRLLPKVRRDLALAAMTIARYEPVSMLVRKEEMNIARRLVGKSVDLIPCPIDDLWIRDTGPVFVIDGEGGKAAIDFNFNGWGEKQEHARDAKVARFVAKRAGVSVLDSDLILEGGGIEVDGHGTAIISESCVLIANRNPGISKSRCEAELKELLGLKKIIWLPGIKGRDITDGHTDFYARFAGAGVVLAGYDPDPNSFDHTVTKRHLRILRTATDARGRSLKVIVLPAPQKIRGRFENEDFAAGYIGFYVCNGAVIMQEFGDRRADETTKSKLKAAFPDREIVPLNLDAIAAGGGSIHCATQQEPRV